MDIVKKIIILALVVWGIIFVYKNFLADTVEGFFNENKGKIDFYQTSYDKNLED